MATSNMADHVGRVLGGRYRVIAPLGTGASAFVYLAEDVSLRRQVAVKILHPGLSDDPAFLKRFRAEAQAAAALSHPNVVAVFDWGQEEGRPYLVTEFLGGGTLRAILDRGNLLSPSQALLVGLDAARGLDYAHRRGFVHRDIKSANLLFDVEGRLRVADFGLARALAEAAWTEPAGVVLGTARYASPEQARGEAVDGRSDVYSLALVLIEAVTGKVPFAADTTVATLMARLDTLLRVPAKLGPLAPVLERAGRPDPAERPTAGELARALIQTAERLPRPAPLPLARTTIIVPASPADHTTLGPTAAGPAAAPRSDDTTIGTPVPAASREPASGAPRRAAVPLYDQEAGENQAEPAPYPAPYRHRRRWPWLVTTLLLVLAGLGVGGWFLFQRESTPTFALPDFTLGTEAEAIANPLFAGANLVSSVTYERRDGTVAGQVLGQDPAAGVSVDEGTVVHLLVSQGQTIVLVPDLTNLSEADARAQLAAAGFAVGEVTPLNDETVPLGVVLDWTNKGTEQEKGTTVGLTVSAGPALRTVPVVLGLPAADAVAALASVQLPATTTEAFSDDVEKGDVISVTPGEGQNLPRDTPVALVVSKGPDLVVVPDVTGSSLDDAITALKSRGFREGQVSGRAGRPVLGTDPRANTSARRGAVVDLILG